MERTSAESIAAARSGTHGERSQILEDLGLAPQHLARAITEAVAQRTLDFAHEQHA